VVKADLADLEDLADVGAAKADLEELLLLPAPTNEFGQLSQTDIERVGSSDSARLDFNIE
jgi:hypothetical protein